MAKAKRAAKAGAPKAAATAAKPASAMDQVDANDPTAGHHKD